MQALEPFLEMLARFLKLDCRFAVTGGVSAIVYGEPRLTNDIDILLGLTRDRAQRIGEHFPQELYYTPPSEVIEIELSRPARGHFNIISHHSGARADVYLRGIGRLERWALAEPRIIDVLGLAIPFAPLEYSIVKKLEFFHQGGSERHLRDLAAVWRISREQIDETLLGGLLAEKQLEKEWERVKQMPFE